MHTTVTANGTVRLFLHHVWKLHGLPGSIISDREPQFMAKFMQELTIFGASPSPHQQLTTLRQMDRWNG
jgi:hypothetical protein